MSNIGIGTIAPEFLLNISEQEDMPAEFVEIVSENFLEIIGGAE